MNYPVVTIGQLPEYLKALRKARGLTQEGLGILLGLKQVRIAEIEANPGSVSVGQMHRLLSALGAQMVLHESSTGWANAAAGSNTTSTGARSPKSSVAGKEVKPPSVPATLKSAKRVLNAAAATSHSRKGATSVVGATPVKTPTKTAPQRAVSPAKTPKRRGVW
jgi:HTH-type transcriptional regulator/antitoxin HipB